MNIKSILILTLSVYLSSCADYRPIVDTQGMDMSNYETDLAQCQQYAEQISTGKDAATGAGIGATVGWALSAVSGGDNKVGASAGAVAGGASGLGKSASSQKDIIKRCLHGRGYKVLN